MVLPENATPEQAGSYVREGTRREGHDHTFGLRGRLSLPMAQPAGSRLGLTCKSVQPVDGSATRTRFPSNGSRTCRSERPSALARQPKPALLILDDPNRYHFRVLDPEVSAILSATMNVVTIGHCYHI